MTNEFECSVNAFQDKPHGERRDKLIPTAGLCWVGPFTVVPHPVHAPGFCKAIVYKVVDMP